MKTLVILVISLLVLSCATSDEILLSSRGTRCDVVLADQTIKGAELLALQNDALYFAADSLFEVPISAIRSVNLDINESRGWIVPVVLLQGLPSLIFLMGTDTKQIGGIGLGTTLLTATLFAVSGPRAGFDKPWNEEDLGILKLHMRYRQELSEQQVAELRKSIGARNR